jgi:outer membrane receptor protein involved in Fe transport
VGTVGAIGVGNIGDGRQTDLAATVTLPLKRIGLNGAMLKGVVTRSWSSVTDPTTGERRRLTYSFATVAELHFTYDLPKQKLNLGFDAFYNSPQPIYRPASVQTIGTWARLLVFVEYRMKPEFTVRLEAVNVTDATPRQTLKSYAGPRNVSPLVYTDVRRLGLDPYVFLKVRRSFN